MKRPAAERVARAAAALTAACLLALLGLWLAPRLSEAFAAWLRTPPVEARDLVVRGGLAVSAAQAAGASMPRGATAADAPQPSAVVLDAGRRFTMVGVSCRPPQDYPALTITLRTSDDGTSWSRWYSAPLEYAAETGGPVRAFIDPLWTGAGRYIEVAAQATADGTSAAELSGVRVTALDTSGGVGPAARAADVARTVATAVATVELVPALQAMTIKPDIVTRRQWGADESWRRAEPSYAPVKLAIVHHTESGNSYSRAEAPGIMRGIYYYHARTLGWSDIAYNFLIDRYGTIYEGRYGGVTEGVIGAQTYGFNTGSTGVSIIGSFMKVKPPAAALDALKRLLAWKLDVHHIDPAAPAQITCGSSEKYDAGQVVTLPAIAGHRDANYTDCPGNTFYALLPSIRTKVAATGLPKIYAASVSRTLISPDGNGADDVTEVTFVVSTPARWTVRVRDAAGATVREFGGTGSAAAARWDGTDARGMVLPDGAYTIVMGAGVDGAMAREALATVVLDTAPPQAPALEVTPDPFSPNGDSQGDTASVKFTPSEPCSVRLIVRGAGGAALRSLTAKEKPGGTLATMRWDGLAKRSGELVPAPEGTATVELTLRDLAGNAATTTQTVTVDRTLGFLTAAPGAFSPNRDGVQEAVAVAFTLTRQARATVHVRRDGRVLATLFSGALEAATHTLSWDGRLADGTAAPGGTYTLRVTASGAIGSSSVSRQVTVDQEAPRLVVPAKLTLKRGKTAALRYTVRDAYSPTVKVWAVVTSPDGSRLATVSAGWVKAGTTGTLRWKPPAKGTYTVTFSALDRAGNRQAVAPALALSVR